MSPQPLPPDVARILVALCAVMEVAECELPGKTTPRTKPRLVWARNMAAFVLHDFGFSDGTVAEALGQVHRITIMVRRRRMAEKLEASQRYRDHHGAILKLLAHDQAHGVASSQSSIRLPSSATIQQPSP